MKKISVDIYAVTAFGLVSSVISFMYLSTDRIDRPTLDSVIVFWLFTTSYALAAYGRKKIEENHPKVFEDLGSPEGIGVNLAEKKGRQYYSYVFGFKFMRLNDSEVNFGYIGSFILCGVALLIIWT